MGETRKKWKLSRDEIFQNGDRVNINAYARQRRLSHIRKSRTGTVVAISARVHVVWDGDPDAEIHKYHPDLLDHAKLTIKLTQNPLNQAKSMS